jgi:hypothetical protein
MRTVLGTLVLLVAVADSWSQPHSVFDERLYRRTSLSNTLLGSSYNGQTIVVYGSHGVILRTDDQGRSWQQYNLPDTLHIIGIRADGRRFVGLCHRWVGIVSDDDGRSWSLRTLADTAAYRTAVEHGGYLFALASDRVCVYDSELRLVDTYWLEPADAGRVLAVTDRYIAYSPGAGTVGLIDRTRRATRLLSLLDAGCDACKTIVNLVTNGTELYVTSTSTYDQGGDSRIRLTRITLQDAQIAETVNTGLFYNPYVPFTPPFFFNGQLHFLSSRTIPP